MLNNVIQKTKTRNKIKENKKQALLKGKISLEILKMLGERQFLASKMIDLALILKEDIKISEEENTFRIQIEGMDIMNIKMKYEKNELRKLKISFFTDLKEIKEQVWDYKLKEITILEILFLKPCNTIVTESTLYACNLEEPRSFLKTQYISRYEKDILRTEEWFERSNRIKRSFYLPEEKGTEIVKENKKINTHNLSNHQFNKKYLNALSLTKEKK